MDVKLKIDQENGHVQNKLKPTISEIIIRQSTTRF